MTHANLPNRMENWNVTGIFALDVFLSHLPTPLSPLFQSAFLLVFISAFCGCSYFALSVSHFLTHIMTISIPVFSCATQQSPPGSLPFPPPPSLSHPAVLFFLIIIIITSCGDAPSSALPKIVLVNFRSATSLFCSMIRYA